MDAQTELIRGLREDLKGFTTELREILTHHDARLRAIENRQNYWLGWAAAIGSVAGVLATVLHFLKP